MARAGRLRGGSPARRGAAGPDGGCALQDAAFVAFGLHALWIWLVSLGLSVGGAGSARLVVCRAAFLMLALAAGSVGVALLIVPRATGAFFAWELAPAPLAAFAGGVYGGFALVTSTLLALGGDAAGAGPRLDPWARGALAAAAVLLGALGVALWVDPVGVAASGPVSLAPLGARFAGSWIALLGTLAGWAAVAGRRDTARLPALALVALPAGALAAALRTGTAPEPYVAALALLMAVGCGVALRLAPRLVGGRTRFARA